MNFPHVYLHTALAQAHIWGHDQTASKNEILSEGEVKRRRTLKIISMQDRGRMKNTELNNPTIY